MYKYFLFILLFLISWAALAQEEPYYEPVGKRSLDELKYLPNLETIQRRVYLSVGGAYRLSNSKIDPTSSFFQSQRMVSLLWDAQLGYNLDDKWFVELAYARNPIFLSTELLSPRSSSAGLTVSDGENFNEFQLRLKRKIIQVDKVPQKAGVFVSTGLSFSPQFANRNLGRNGYVGSMFNGTTAPPDTIFYSIETQTQNYALALELGLELSGRLSDQLAIGVFAKSWWRPQGSIYNDLSYRINSTEINSVRQDIGSFNFNFGILIYFNMVNWVKYKNQSGK